MSRSTTETYVCDRCNATQDVAKGGNQARAWGALLARNNSGDPGISLREDDGSRPVDLCPSCLESLHAWWRQPRRQAQAALATTTARAPPADDATTDDGLPWGYLDPDGEWREVPKQPLLLANLGPPPFSVTLPDGRTRQIVHKPKGDTDPDG